MKQENGNYICQCSGVSNDTVSCDTINVITKAQRIFYIENGYLVVENILSTEKLEKVGDALSAGDVDDGVRICPRGRDAACRIRDRR